MGVMNKICSLSPIPAFPHKGGRGFLSDETGTTHLDVSLPHRSYPDPMEENPSMGLPHRDYPDPVRDDGSRKGGAG